jgi:predicted transcriptional regulator
MARNPQDVTEAELAVLQALWDRGSSTIRQLAEAIYTSAGTSQYATVQKLLERASINLDELIGRRLRAMADRLCGGSLTPLLTHLVRAEALSEGERSALRNLIETAANPEPPGTLQPDESDQNS